MADNLETTTAPGNPRELHLKMQLQGRVTSIDLYGAFVDIGVGQDALVHISKIRKGPINRVEEALSVGDEVTVYVDKIDPRAGRVSLTMIKPLDVSWGDIQAGNVYHGTITRLEAYGLFVEIGAERPGMVHISELAEQHIRHPSELYAVGDHIDVRVVNCDRKKRRIDLALASTGSEAEPDEADVEGMESFTAMEFAMRKAMDSSDSDYYARRRAFRQGRQKQNDVQDDILSRTLRHRRS
jgi:ribosomal protein S1